VIGGSCSGLSRRGSPSCARLAWLIRVEYRPARGGRLVLDTPPRSARRLSVLRFCIPFVCGAGAQASCSRSWRLSGRFTDIGIDDNFMKDAAAALTPGQAALCVLVRKVTADKVLPVMAGFGGKVLRTNLTTEQGAKLQEALKA
jgi:hypothetical protein